MSRIARILRSQAGQFGSFMQGFQGGLSLGENIRAQRERAKLEKQKAQFEEQRIKLIEQELAQKQKEFQRAEVEQQARDALAEQFRAPRTVTTTGPTIETEPGLDVPVGQVQRQEQRPAGLREQLIATALQSQKTPFGEILKSLGTGAGPGGLAQDPEQLRQQREFLQSISPQGTRLVPSTTGQGQVTFRGDLPRDPLGVEAVAFAIQRRIAEGTATPADLEIAKQISQGQANLPVQMRGQLARQGAQEAELGKLGVRSTPAFQQTEEDIARKRAEGSTAGRPLEGATAKEVSTLDNLLANTLPLIRQTLDPNFLGPIKGTELAFAGRRRVGSLVGMPVGSNETQFRLALKDVSDQLLRARSGAQINEQEFKRLRGILPQPTDEPDVFAAGLARFEQEIRALAEQKRRTGVTPKGKLPPIGTPTPSAVGAQSQQRLRFNLQTGRIE